MPRRRDDILLKAARIFADRGFAGTSIRDIAAECQLLPASLYSHFHSKTQILDEILTPFFDQLLPRLAAGAARSGSGRSRLTTLLEQALACCSENLFAYRIVFHDWNFIAREPSLDHIVQRTAEASSLWLEVVTAGVSDGSLRGDIPPNVVIRIIQPMLYGVLDDRYDMLFPEGQQPPASEIAQVVQTILLAGMTGPQRGGARGGREALSVSSRSRR